MSVHRKIVDGVKMNKRDTERFAAQYGIEDKNAVKELCELAIVLRARQPAQSKKPFRERYDAIVALYRSQVNLSHRTSQSVMLQQYSTPAPIAFLAGSFVKSNVQSAAYFEPSAGNGLLTVALPGDHVTVNEIDEFRSKNLAEQPFANRLRQDATEPFGMDKMFDGIITNPPFGKLGETLTFDGFPINTLDHVMTIRALDCMKDNGRAAIIIGGHTEWDSAGRIKAGKNRIFFSYLYRHYHVADVINIDGDLYSRQGTSFDVRLILIDGRKATPEGYPPLKDRDDKTVKDFDNLFERVAVLIENRRLRMAKAKAAAKLKTLHLLKIRIGMGAISGLNVKNAKLSPYTIAGNCTDFADCKSGAYEIIEAQKKCEQAGKKIPSFYASRLKKIESKAILQYGANGRWVMDIYGDVYGHWNFSNIAEAGDRKRDFKIIKKADLKYAKKSEELEWLAAGINAGGSRQESALWMLDPRCTSNDRESRKAMSELLYSLAKNAVAGRTDDGRNTEANADDVFNEVANRLDTAPSFVERWLRGMKYDGYKVSVQTQFGLNHIIIE